MCMKLAQHGPIDTYTAGGLQLSPDDMISSSLCTVVRECDGVCVCVCVYAQSILCIYYSSFALLHYGVNVSIYTTLQCVIHAL